MYQCNIYIFLNFKVLSLLSDVIQLSPSSSANTVLVHITHVPVKSATTRRRKVVLW